MKEQIGNLIAKGRIKEAIELLDKKNPELGLNLMARYNRLHREEMLNIISREQANLDRNRIVWAILSEFDIDPNTSLNFKPIKSHPTEIPIQSVFVEIDKVWRFYHKRNPILSQEADSIRSEYEEYQKQKRLDSTYDPTGRRLAGLKQKADNFIKKVNESKSDDVENIISKIKEHIKDPLPKWDDIQSAYNLLIGRNIQDDDLANVLKARPDDDEAKYIACDRITHHLNKLVR